MWSRAWCQEGLEPPHAAVCVLDDFRIQAGEAEGGVVTCQAECGWHGSRRSRDGKRRTWT